MMPFCKTVSIGCSLALLGLGAASLRAREAPAASDPSPQAVARALELVSARDFEAAIAILEPLHEAGTASPIARASLGALYLEIGFEADALRILQPLAEPSDANPAVLYNAGRAALALGQGELGEGFLSRCVEQQPLSPAARALGLLRAAQGRPAEAFKLLQPWAVNHPEDREARVGAALGALQSGRLPEATALLEGLPDGDPRVALLRADVFIKRRDPRAAADLLEPLVAEVPSEMRVDLMVLLSTAYVELGHSADAVELLRDQPQGNPRLALSLARAQYRGGDVKAALETLSPFAERLPAPGTLPDKPLNNRPLMASVALEEGRLLLLDGQAERATVFLRLASELNPYSREAWQELGRALAATGDQTGAEAALARLQALAEAKERAKIPGFTGQRRQEDSTGQRLAEALEWFERGDSEQALNIIRQEISLAPEDPRPRLLEVRTLINLGQADAALSSIEVATELFPENPDVLHFRAVVRLARKELQLAEADLHSVLALRGDHLPAMNDLALVHQLQGELDVAREWLDKVLAASPDDPLAKQRLASLGAGTE